MANNKIGLHKDIASIFDGVPLTKGAREQRPSCASASQHPGCRHPEPPSPTCSLTVPPAPAQTQAPSQAPAQAPAPQQPVYTPPKSAVPEQRRADVAIEAGTQDRLQQIWEQIKGKLLASKPGANTSKQKAMVILVPVLFIVFIIVFSQVLSTPVRGAKGPQVPSAANAAAVAGDNIDWQIPDPYPTTLRDPMRFDSGAINPDQTDRPIVKGIIYSESGSSAVVGNQIVREGEKVSGATVVKINKDSVEFDLNGKKWTQKVQ